VRTFAKFEAVAQGVVGTINIASGAWKMFAAASAANPLLGAGLAAAAVIGIGVGAAYSTNDLNAARMRHGRRRQREAISNQASQAQSTFDNMMGQAQSSALQPSFGNSDRESLNLDYSLSVADRASRYANQQVETADWSRRRGILNPQQFHQLSGEANRNVADAETQRMHILERQRAILLEQREIVAEAGRRQLENAERITASLESQLQLEEQKVRVAVEGSRRGAVAYGEMNEGQRREANRITEKLNRGERLTEGERSTARSLNLGGAVDAQSEAAGNAAGYQQSAYGQAMRQPVRQAERQRDLVEENLDSARQEAARVKKETEDRLTAEFGEKLKTVEDSIVAAFTNAFNALRLAQRMEEAAKQGIEAQT